MSVGEGLHVFSLNMLHHHLSRMLCCHCINYGYQGILQAIVSK